MNYPGYLIDRLELGYGCEKDLESINISTVSKEMFSLLGIKRISVWVSAQDFNFKKLKQPALALGMSATLKWAALNGVDLASPSFYAPVLQTPIEVVLVKGGGSGGSGGPSNFPITPPVSRGQPAVRPSTGKGLVPYVPFYRVAPPTTGLGQNPGGNYGGGNGGGGGSSSSIDTENTCPNPNGVTPENSDPIHKLTPSRKRKKKKNEHLDTKIEIQDETFTIERLVSEKKGPGHGPDFDLEPERSADGEIVRDRKTNKPRSKQNKQTYEQFPKNVEKFMRNEETKIERNKFYRKGRENQQNGVLFINHREKRFAIFNAETKKFITGWVMDQAQYDNYLETGNII